MEGGRGGVFGWTFGLVLLLVQAADGGSLSPAERSVDADRERLRRLVAAEETPRRPSDLGDLLRSPDRGVRLLAARVAARRPETDDVAPLAEFLTVATPGELRSFVESAAAPLPAAWAELCRLLFFDAGHGRAGFSIELTARLEPTVAEEVFLSFLDASATRGDLQDQVLLQLAGVPSPRSAEALSLLRHAADPAVRDAAGQALAALRGHLLAEAKTPEALAVLKRARLEDPTDLPLLLHESLVEGVYLATPHAPLARLDHRFRDLNGLEAAAARDAAELALGRAVLHWFAGDGDAARAALDDALARIGRPAPNQRAAATTRARILLVASIFELHDRGATEVARARVLEADRIASVEETYCRFDDALDGSFGPLTLLGHLRRQGKEDVRIRWYALADEVLASTPIGVALDPEDAPAAGTDAAAVASERVRSWLPCRRAWALYEAGRLDRCRAVARRVETILEKSELWNNRLLAAECALVLGHASTRAGDAETAREAYRRAERAFEELGEEGLRYELEEQQGLYVEGAAPQRPHHGERRAQALVGLGEVRLRFDHDAAGAADAFRRAHDAAPDNTTVLLRHAAMLAAGEDPERALRLLASTPRRAGLVVGLAELARALGRDEDASRLFELHLAWNALTEDRAAQEREWADRLPAPGAGE